MIFAVFNLFSWLKGSLKNSLVASWVGETEPLERLFGWCQEKLSGSEWVATALDFWKV